MIKIPKIEQNINYYCPKENGHFDFLYKYTKNYFNKNEMKCDLIYFSWEIGNLGTQNSRLEPIC